MEFKEKSVSKHASNDDLCLKQQQKECGGAVGPLLPPVPPPQCPLGERRVVQLHISPAATSTTRLSPGSIQSKLQYTASGGSGTSSRVVSVLLHYSRSGEEGGGAEHGDGGGVEEVVQVLGDDDFGDEVLGNEEELGQEVILGEQYEMEVGVKDVAEEGRNEKKCDEGNGLIKARERRMGVSDE